MDNQEEMLYSPAEVERQLGVKGSTLRNYAKAYENVYGGLYRGTRNERLWPAEALRRLDAARRLLQSGQAVSLEAALGALAKGDAEVSSVLAEVRQPEPMMLVLEELRALRQEVGEMRQENATLREQLQALPAPQEPSQAEYVARLEQLYAEADKRAQYAVDELKRRDLGAQPKHRGWWPWGKR